MNSADRCETSFNRLLRWLDDGADSGGEAYLSMRRRLVSYFDRRNCPSPDALADETFDRISRTLDAEGIRVRPPARYCYVVARFVLLEDIRARRRDVWFDDGRHERWMADRPVADALPPVECLERCLQSLEPDDRDLILEYYRDSRRQRIERRRALASRLGVSMNALAIRVWRLRASLERSLSRCAAGSCTKSCA